MELLRTVKVASSANGSYGHKYLWSDRAISKNLLAELATFPETKQFCNSHKGAPHGNRWADEAGLLLVVVEDALL